MHAVRREREREGEKGRDKNTKLAAPVAGAEQREGEREGEKDRKSLQLVERHLHPPARCSVAELTLQSSDSTFGVSGS